jgi:hypothetical protein
MFRETLLVHAERAQEIRYKPDGSLLRHLHIAALVPPVEEQTRLDNSRQEYRQADDSTLFTNDPGIKAALDALSARWPWTLSRQELVDAVHARLVSAGFNPSATLPDHIDSLMGVLILQGQARCRLDPVLPDAAPTPLRLDETARRMAELTRRKSMHQPSTSGTRRTCCRRLTATCCHCWTAPAIAMHWWKLCWPSPAKSRLISRAMT